MKPLLEFLIKKHVNKIEDKVTFNDFIKWYYFGKDIDELEDYQIDNIWSNINSKFDNDEDGFFEFIKLNKDELIENVKIEEYSNKYFITFSVKDVELGEFKTDKDPRKELELK